MPKRALIAIASLALLGAACVSTPKPEVDYGVGARFVPFVVDSTDDMGQGDAVAFSADGSPYIAYFGYPAIVKEGDIAIPRPFGSPAVPGVMLSTSSTDGIWQRGAVNTTEPDLTATGVSVPFGPVLTPALDLAPANSNGTAVVVADDGTVHVAWVMGAGVYHASTKLGGSSVVNQVFDFGSTVDQAGPIGRPGITLDGDGNPWIAFTVDSSTGQQVHVTHPNGDNWVDQLAATTAPCNGCASPQPTGIGVIGGVPVVVYADPSANAVTSAVLDGSTWAPVPVADEASGLGLSFAAAGDVAYAAYFTGAGSVDVATFKDGAWSTTPVHAAADPDPSAVGSSAAGTAVAVDSAATTFVAWEDGGIQLASGSATTSFALVDLGHTVTSGEDPALAASDAGVALSWYESDQQNQMIGFWGDLQDVLVAQPSPSLTISQGPPPTAECGKDKKVVLSEVAKATAFEVACLVAPAGQPFTLTFDNEDAGVTHNVAIYTDSSSVDNLFSGDIFAGVSTVDYKVPALDAGTYFFKCDVHANMTGAFAVVQGAK